MPPRAERPLATVCLILLVSLLLGARCTLVRLPSFASSDPASGATVSRSHWPVLTFASAVDPLALAGIFGECDGALFDFAVHLLASDVVVVNPTGLLPAGASCALHLNTVDGALTIPFQTQAAGAALTATYDRRDRNQPLPFPDDAFLEPDASKPSGWRPEVVAPDHHGAVQGLLEVMGAVASAGADGWSPLGNISVHLSGAVDPASLPLDPEASLDPLASIQLVDLTPGADSYGERVPFKLTPRADSIQGGPLSHDLVLFASIPLEPLGRYGLVVTNRVRGASGQPLGRSAFFEAAVGPPVGGEEPEIAKVRPLAEEVMAAAADLAPVPIPREDVALALRISIRSTGQFVDDVLDMRSDVLGVPPNVQITSTYSGFGDIAAFVEGTFDVPVWRSGAFVARDAQGLPDVLGTQSIPFILALPASAATLGNAPIVLYQHGNPGSAENEVPWAADLYLGAGGYAVGGFTDILNRTYASTAEQSLAIFGVVLVFGDAPDFFIETYAHQIAFLQALQDMGTWLDVLPLGSPDGLPDLDPTSIVYQGTSNGSVHGQAFLAYEPDLLAGALVVGATSLAETLEYQDRTTPDGGDPLLMVTLPPFIAGVTPPDIWMGLALFAVSYDRQDPQNHARFLYRAPVLVEGTTQKASILVSEGIGDSFTKNNTTRRLARLLGAPHLTPVSVPVSYLDTAAPPVQGNVDSTTTAAFQQFVPAGIPPLAPTPGCEFQFEGHFCAQTAPGALQQRLDFYDSAVTQPVPTIGAP